MLKAVGTISEINRYPVKSFAGESVEESRVEAYGLFGDRFYAFVDETKEGWNSYFTARAIPEMLRYQASIAEEGASDNGNVRLNVTSPDGQSFQWDERLLREMQRLSKAKMSMSKDGLPGDDLMAVDTASILIITDTTLRRLEAIWGKKLDRRRFRANIVISVDDREWDENKWIGSRLSAGSAELQVDQYCERCSLITLDPDTLERDVSILKKVNEEMNLHFGVYASVVKPGRIRAGEQVFLHTSLG